MPRFEYKCEQCGTIVEEEKPVAEHDKAPEVCPVCGARNSMKQVITSPPAIDLTKAGPGTYFNDYRMWEKGAEPFDENIPRRRKDEIFSNRAEKGWKSLPKYNRKKLLEKHLIK